MCARGGGCDFGGRFAILLALPSAAQMHGPPASNHGRRTLPGAAAQRDLDCRPAPAASFAERDLDSRTTGYSRWNPSLALPQRLLSRPWLWQAMGTEPWLRRTLTTSRWMAVTVTTTSAGLHLYSGPPIGPTIRSCTSWWSSRQRAIPTMTQISPQQRLRCSQPPQQPLRTRPSRTSRAC